MFVWHLCTFTTTFSRSPAAPRSLLAHLWHLWRSLTAGRRPGNTTAPARLWLSQRRSPASRLGVWRSRNKRINKPTASAVGFVLMGRRRLLLILSSVLLSTWNLDFSNMSSIIHIAITFINYFVAILDRAYFVMYHLRILYYHTQIFIPYHG